MPRQIMGTLFLDGKFSQDGVEMLHDRLDDALDALYVLQQPSHLNSIECALQDQIEHQRLQEELDCMIDDICAALGRDVK